jgi:hypothetical protein
MRAGPGTGSRTGSGVGSGMSGGVGSGMSGGDGSGTTAGPGMGSGIGWVVMAVDYPEGGFPTGRRGKDRGDPFRRSDERGARRP